ncbi:MAG: methylenetetrahydrofolate--tRNA-(uracil(54)-C(5))-methyltransferase (FADH(2)-oxidizing) TrmFO [Synergistaceae bacterium]|jgi:methylenetetrahydrofolate--tRNA-(uracil-5-)-methyltransferase|nr:methylenetetrahydrofolate--tRNA-(uracil(54)-C(5))-methyltransferase (FADH(2)-oxidizing) TrmFO [Synergistaceae bacterium]
MILTIIGGGLAGCEAAWQAASRGVRVRLFEMRPLAGTPAHTSGRLAEVVCSNSFGSVGSDSAAGILKAELSLCGSLILDCAHACSVPAGGALAVDRAGFSELVERRIEAHPNIEVVRTEIDAIPETGIIATGPMTSPRMAAALRGVIGDGPGAHDPYLSFFDAVAPIVTRESVNMDKAWLAGRYGRGNDYINCPMNEAEYAAFYGFLTRAEQAGGHGGADSYFEGCMPIEVMAKRGVDTLRFGPMKPVGLTDPRTGRLPYAAVQLRQDDAEGRLFNIVGFQTGLKWGEQAKLIHMIPGLEEAEIVRFGVMHENIYVNAPRVLDQHLQLRARPGVFLAGQLTGVEGYMESTAMGLAAGVNAARTLLGLGCVTWPRPTAIGSLINYLMDAGPDGSKNFQPMNANLGIFPPLDEKVKDKKLKARLMYERAIACVPPL